MKYCWFCKTDKLVSEFQKLDHIGRTVELKTCNTCRTRLRGYAATKRRKTPQAYTPTDRKRQYEYNKDMRNFAIDKLGGVCCKCGFSDRRALQIDHVKGDGADERRKIGSAYTRLVVIINDTENRYQLLCANCNWIKRHENGEALGNKRIF